MQVCQPVKSQEHGTYGTEKRNGMLYLQSEVPIYLIATIQLSLSFAFSGTPCYFFFFPFFFLTPAVAIPPAAGITLDDGTLALASSCLIGGAGDAVVMRGTDAGAGGGGRMFDIFCIRERLRASKRPRKTDEWVLNLRH